ncbi:hypothetical protein BRADI_4g03897v3 [Brachypodium distachyon]|uniref:Uncharacterized protein n=1 Tax=Brachypodium distachyon TaxID=15368 RepID=A0A0Q3GZ40_BRADI|nr:hypothetical protein BRADI_4g03897v3 [Brachypodium distachyon]
MALAQCAHRWIPCSSPRRCASAGTSSGCAGEHAVHPVALLFD